jgi:hypothetical protein
MSVTGRSIKASLVHAKFNQLRCAVQQTAAGGVATKLHRLEENLDAANVSLTTGDLKEIHDAISAIDVQGDRYPTHLQSLVNR